MENNKKCKFIVLICFVLFFICSVVCVNAAETVNIEEIETSYKGVLIKVSASKKIVTLRMYQKDTTNNWIRFFEDASVGETSKNYFISKYRLSTDNKTELKVVAVLEDGTETSSEIEVNKIPEEPVLTTPSPSASSSSTTTPSTTPTVTSTPTPSTTPSPSTNQNEPVSISLNKSSVTLYTNGKDTYTLKATVKPSGTGSKVTWSTSNNKVAKISSSGVITAVGKGSATITVKTTNGKSATCKVTVKKLGNISKTLSKSNCTKKVSVTPKVSGCSIAQSFCLTDKYYVCALIKKGDSKQVLQVYNKNGKYIKKFVYTDMKHANGMTYNPDNGLMYLVPMNGGKYFTFKASSISNSKLTRGSGTFKYSASGAAYDVLKKQMYTTAGKTIRRYDSDLKHLNSFQKYDYHTGQDIGCYNGLALVIDYVSKGNSYIYVQRASDGEYLGKYHVTLPGELESVSYDQYNKEFALYFNYGNNNAIYTTTAIKLDNYCK